MLLTRTSDGGPRARSAITSTPETLSGLDHRSAASLEEALASFRTAPAVGRFRMFILGRPRTLKRSVQEQVYLIAHEALINATRHSRAGHIEAEIDYSAQRLRVVIRDDGCGIDAARLRAHGPNWGLVGMRDRATAIGAQLKIWSRPGAGTEIEIVVAGAVESGHAI